MIDGMLKYLNLAESRLSRLSLTQKSDFYNIILDSLVKAGQVCLFLSIYLALCCICLRTQGSDCKLSKIKSCLQLNFPVLIV